MQVEVRIPTYQRPELLKRSLASLRSQTYKDWVALVFDDSPSFEAANIVSGFRDKRIFAKVNKRRLGAAGNIDQCFSKRAFFESNYAFVLEDDNAIDPLFIESNLDSIIGSGASILLRNQKIFEQSDDGWRPTGETTKSQTFQRDGMYSAKEVHSIVFFDDCVANGGLFWDLNTLVSDLSVGPSVSDSGIQEFCRTIQISDELLYCSEPLGIWTRMPDGAICRSRLKNREFGRALQAIKLFLLSSYGPDFPPYLLQRSKELGLLPSLRKSLLGLGDFRCSLSMFFQYPGFSDFLKGYARRAFAKNVLSDYFLSAEFPHLHRILHVYNKE